MSELDIQTAVSAMYLSTGIRDKLWSRPPRQLESTVSLLFTCSRHFLRGFLYESQIRGAKLVTLRKEKVKIDYSVLRMAAC